MAESTSLPVIFLMGPTAAGKTGAAVELVRRLPLEIVSVDSALVYRGMDVGTAKPGPHVLAEAPHRLIDIADPAEAYSAARFREDALREIEAIHAQGRVPLLVGGTRLYFRALEQGLASLPQAEPELRARLEAEARRLGWPALHARLATLDPVTAGRLHPSDAQRVQRALEVVELTGRPLSELLAVAEREGLPYPLVKWVVAPQQRRWLHERIALRFDEMLAQGLIAEVEALRARGDLDLSLPSMRAVGYRQIWEYLDGSYDFERTRERAVAATRQLAKRQFTWLRSEQGIEWFDSQDPALLRALLERARQALAPYDLGAR